MLHPRIPRASVGARKPKPLAWLHVRDLQAPPRMPSGDEQMARLLVRNAFVQGRDDRMVPQVYDDLVALVWYRGRFVPAVIAHERFTPLVELDRLHRDVDWVLFLGTKEELRSRAAPARSVRGRRVAYPQGFNRSSNARALWHWLRRRRRERNFGYF